MDAWLGLVAMESVFYAAWGACATLVVRLPLWPLWSAALWVAMEWASGTFPFGGFPWLRVAFSQGESVFTPYAALGGAPLVSFAVALCGGLIALLVLRLAPAPRWERAVALPLIGVLAVPVAAFAVPRPGDEGKTVTMGIIQGNVPGRGMDPLGDEPAVVLENHTRMLHEMAQAVRAGKTPKPDVVVLPENSTDIDPLRSDFAYREIDAAVKDIGVPVLVGAVVGIGENNRATRSLVWDPVTGPGAYYDKQKLVPFGEYTPLKDLVLALFKRAGLVGKQSVPGTRDGDLKLGPVTIGAVNCYEVAFDGVVGGTGQNGRHAAGGADQQRHLRADQPAGAAAGHVPDPRGRAQPGGGHRRDHRYLRLRDPRGLDRLAHRRTGARDDRRDRSGQDRGDDRHARWARCPNGP